MSQKTLKILLPPFNKEFNADAVRSASQYIISSHLVRNLISVDSYLRISGDLADSWTISNDSSQFTFHIRDGARYSDGSAITAHDFEMTIKRQMSSNQATHFDFSRIESVTSSDHTLTISLTSPSQNFLYSLNHPEFGVLCPFDYKSPIGKAALKVTSGPFFLVEANNNYVYLRKNPYFQTETNYPEGLEIFGHDLKENVDFVFTVRNDSLSKKYRHDPKYHSLNPHIGFTFWVSFDSNHLSPRNRKWLQSILQLNFSDFSNFDGYWLPARQLYLPDGFGRLNTQELTEIWENIENNKSTEGLPKKINILLDEKFPFNQIIVSKLSKYFETINVDTYESMDQFESLYQSDKYDLFLINNDFSSSDLLENIKVTFNPSRPLIKDVKQKKISNLINKAEQALYPKDKARYLKEIEKIVLIDAAIAPLAYMNVRYFVNNHLDISQWSMLSPEIAFWKAEWKN